MQRTQQLIPRLRFPEFRDEWQIKTLGELAEYKNGQAFEDQVDGSGKYNLVTLNSIDINGDLQKKHKKIKATDGSLRKNDLVMVLSDVAHGNFLGLTAIIPSDDFVLNQRMGQLRVGNSNTNTSFLRSYINKNQRYFKKHGAGSSQQNLSKGDIVGFKVPLPSSNEQGKIANFLTVVDEKIELIRKRIGLLKMYKKGVMQAIFSQKLRFKPESGKSFPDWEEKKLGEVVKIAKGIQLNGSELTKTGSYPMINGGIGPSGYTNKFNEEAETITISEGGNSCGFVGYLTEKFWSGGHCYTIQPSSEVGRVFLYQQLKFYQLKIMRLRVGSGLPNIQRGNLLKLLVMLPALNEQGIISEFLTTIDDRINLEESKLEQAKRFKKALLQQMFV